MATELQSKALPDTAFYRRMRAGHKTRTGHDLDARLVTDDGALWRVDRSCCGGESGSN